MAVNNISTACRNAMADACVDSIDTGSTDSGGELRLYTTSFGTLLSVTDFANPAFGAASSGAAAASGYTDEASAPATGTAAVCRVVDRDNNTVFEGTVGLTGSGADVELSSVSITTGDAVTLSSITVTQPAS